MKKKLKPVILLLFTILFLQGAYGQAKVNASDNLIQKFEKYCASVPREEIYIHSDRDAYISGENLWFSAYLIDRKSFKPSLISRIVYFELLNPENRPVVQKRISIDKGIGTGQIVLPDTLTTGTYTIRAYTSWMKNFLPYNCFMKDIEVYNAFNTKELKRRKIADDILKGGAVTENNQGLFDSRLTLNINNLKPDILEILVNADENFRNRNNNLFYLFIQTHGNIDHVSSEKITGEATKIVIPKTLLTSGINHITLFDSGGQPICERYIFTPATNRDLFNIRSADSFSTRSKVSLEIEPSDALSGALPKVNLSISVTPVTNMPDIMNLNDYLVFGTEFGIPSSDTFTGRRISGLSPDAIDSLMLSLKSNWIVWDAILSGDIPFFKYRTEREDHYLSGKLLNRDQKAAVSDELLLLSSPGKVAIFKYAKTDNHGSFNFNIHIDEGLKDLLIQPDEISKNQTVKIESPFSDQYLQSEIMVDLPKRPIPPYISKWSINYQVQKIYGSSYLGDPVNRDLPPVKPKRFYGRPDIELIMADYIKLPVMQEVFFELIPGVFLKNKKSGYEISIADPVSNKPYGTAPGLMIDGVIINDPSIIANLDPEIVEKIDVVNEKYFIGDYTFFGIVNVISKAGDYSCVTLPDYAIRMPYRVIDPVRSFVSPDYSSAEIKNRRIPDFRNTLYWNPSILPGKDGKTGVEFWTSDYASDYEINIQGITVDGKPISFKKIIKVR